VIATHHRETTDGEPVHPSPFLSSIDTTHLSDTERQQLRSADLELPVSIKTMLSSNPEAETYE
jgi:hypothetical protein